VGVEEEEEKREKSPDLAIEATKGSEEREMPLVVVDEEQLVVLSEFGCIGRVNFNESPIAAGRTLVGDCVPTLVTTVGIGEGNSLSR
jgi:hypothetical protein